MDKRIESLKEIEKGIFTTKKNYLKSKNESGYIKYRILRPLLKLKYYFFRKFNYPSPWLSPSSIKFLKSYLTKDMVGFEFGSGISTLFIAPKVKHLTSIEHNNQWYSLIVEKLKSSNINNVDYKFIAQEKLNEDNNCTELKSQYDFDSRSDYYSYYKAAESIPDESLDFIIVDGRARPECVFHALKKMKKDAMIILDNSERDRYKVVFEMLCMYETYTTTNGLTDTTFWFKN